VIEGIVGAKLDDSFLGERWLGRIGRPEDIAPAAVFLASSDSDWMTGETLYISGGRR
jgi:3-oxoacyl-[acyl-carrier protein] reductase